MAKSKKLTNREKKLRAELKKKWQEEGVIPPDKPKLNRKQFIEETRMEWNSREVVSCVWDFYLVEAFGYMMAKKEGLSGRASLEAVGAAKVLRIALRLHKFYEEIKAKGEHEYKLMDQYEYIKDILDA